MDSPDRLCEQCGGAIKGDKRRGRCKPCYRRLIKQLKKSGQYAPVPGSAGPPRSLARRIDDLRDDPSKCWEWDGEKNERGYGRASIDGKTRPAHRAVYEHLRGPVPEGLVLDHLCRNRLCVNPDHLEPVTNTTNIMRGVGVGAQNASKTHCINGHEFTPENTRLNKPVHPNGDPTRTCRQCHRDRQRRYHAAKRSVQNGALS